ncbi:MAG: hypothetical protein LBK82_16970, partial [Planctomycetaceae bacterium]|nr:hypothetical protein [Planctomycetaceae bacterium]
MFLWYCFPLWSRVKLNRRDLSAKGSPTNFRVFSCIFVCFALKYIPSFLIFNFMLPILKNEEIAPNIFEMVVEHPRLAQKAQPGHFVIVMSDAEVSERIPLTVADFDRKAGTITLVIMAIGTSTKKLVQLKAGEKLSAMIGPLGHA